MDEGGFFEGRRVELLDGEIFDMGAMNSPHATALTLAAQALADVFGPGHFLRNQQPFAIDARSELQPDIAIVAGEVRDYVYAHPTRAVLLIEVSDSSLRFDRSRKARAYARAGIEDCWIINLAGQCVEVCRQPDPEQLRGYREITVYEAGARIAPLAAPEASVGVDELLP
jgi:Uma2 family endonuclease